MKKTENCTQNLKSNSFSSIVLLQKCDKGVFRGGRTNISHITVFTDNKEFILSYTKRLPQTPYRGFAPGSHWGTSVP